MNNKKKIILIILSVVNLIMMFIPIIVTSRPCNPDPSINKVTVYISLFSYSLGDFNYLIQKFNSLNFFSVVKDLIIYMAFVLNLVFSLLLLKKDKFLIGVTITSFFQIIAWLLFSIPGRAYIGFIPLIPTLVVFILSIIFRKKDKELVSNK